MKILIIEDDAEIAKAITSFLKSNGIVVDYAENGEKGTMMALINKYDVILLDYNLPDTSGSEIINKIREDKKTTPIIMVTVRSELDDKISMLDLGADDYITKPFIFRELLARIKTVARRPQVIEPELITVKDLELDSNKFKVTRNGKNINLRTKEFLLLEYMMKNKGRLLSRQDIMDHVWDENADPFSNTIEVHIMNLRKKIETKNNRFIHTIPNRGYRFE